MYSSVTSAFFIKSHSYGRVSFGSDMKRYIIPCSFNDITNGSKSLNSVLSIFLITSFFAKNT